MTRSPTARSEAHLGQRARRQLRTALDEAIALLGGDGGFVYLLANDQGSLTMTMSSGLDLTRGGRALQRIRLPARTGLVGVAMRERTVAISGDYAADVRFAHDTHADRFMREAE